MNPFLPFIGLSLAAHLLVIIFVKMARSSSRDPSSSPKVLTKYLSIGVVTLVAAVVLISAGMIIRTSIYDAHSNYEVAKILLHKLDPPIPALAAKNSSP